MTLCNDVFGGIALRLAATFRRRVCVARSLWISTDAVLTIALQGWELSSFYSIFGYLTGLILSCAVVFPVSQLILVIVQVRPAVVIYIYLFTQCAFTNSSQIKTGVKTHGCCSKDHLWHGIAHALHVS